MKLTVCILTAGIGSRMGSRGTFLNKALFPLNNKPIISHIFDKFPKNTEYVIALGYQADQVKNFLKTFHYEKSFKFVTIKKYIGEYTGPGLSLYACKRYLKKNFIFVSCDTLWTNKISFSSKKNWVGTARVSSKISNDYCNFLVKNHKIQKVKNKIKYNSKFEKSFVGLMQINNWEIFFDDLKKNYKKNYQIYSGFESLINKNYLTNQSIKWIDLGTEDKYKVYLNNFHKYDFSKSKEITYFNKYKVIKFTVNKEIQFQRYKKYKINSSVFPRKLKVSSNLLSYDFIKGNTLYTKINKNNFKKLLIWLEKKLWIKPDKSINIKKLCHTFYKNKTEERLQLFFKTIDVKYDRKKINSVKFKSINYLLSKIDWKYLCNGIPSFIHGDLQFDNIILGKKFTLIDWRQDFAGSLYGDKYYDLSKLYGGMLINYDLIKLNKMYYKENKNEIFFNFKTRNIMKEINEIYKRYIIYNNYDFKKISIITGLIFLNMSPLHNYPFNKICYCMGKKLLQDTLIK